MKSTEGALGGLWSLVAAGSLLLAGCSPRGAPPSVETARTTAPPATTEGPAPSPLLQSPTTAPVRIPRITLTGGEYTFRVDGEARFVFSRNIAGYQQTHFAPMLSWSRDAGTHFVRLTLDDFGMGYHADGSVDANWAVQWDLVFDEAEDKGILVVPVLATWYEWNAGPGYSTWGENPLNQALGGPAVSPAELFQPLSPTQSAWFDWVRTLVQRWQGRDNLLAWEVFSEVNLASGVSESSGIAFVNRAAEVIRAADRSGRPVTASLAETGTWPAFYRETEIDFINVHPYPPDGRLDRAVIKMVRDARSAYEKPVLIGESGLSAATPDSAEGRITLAANAATGLRHAIWAGMVSGAMNGRSFWWEDGVGIYFADLGLPWLQNYADLEAAASAFSRELDFSGLRPIPATSTGGAWGAALGNEQMIIGWYRDAACEPPDWPANAVVSGQTVTLTVPGSAAAWTVFFYDTKTGAPMPDTTVLTPQGGKLTIPLPDFSDDIAFKAYPQ